MVPLKVTQSNLQIFCHRQLVRIYIQFVSFLKQLKNEKHWANDDKLIARSIVFVKK